MRVAVIGARRVRQGVGPYLARSCDAAGAQVAAVVGTSPETAEAAADALAGVLRGGRPHPVSDVRELDAVGGLDALVVAGPHGSHEPWLQRAFDLRLHVLCEKPLVWGGRDPDLRAEAWGRAFQAAGLWLRVHAQWPRTLPTYLELFPDVPRLPTRFEMRLAPASRGPAMFLDALSHPLSLLAQVLPDPEAEIVDPKVSLDAGGEAGRVRFGYRSGDHEIDCRVHLQRVPDAPRPAAYGFDGHMARRLVHLPDYTMELEDAGRPARRIPLPDPSALLVRSFVETVSAHKPPGIDRAVLPGMRHLARLMDAVAAALPLTEDAARP